MSLRVQIYTILAASSRRNSNAMELLIVPLAINGYKLNLKYKFVVRQVLYKIFFVLFSEATTALIRGTNLD